jgi:putative holliday junction resolvase
LAEPLSLINTQSADFAASLPNQGRLAGLDVGTRTIGLALCDAGWRIATPACVWQRQNFRQDIAWLRQTQAEQRLVGLVIGLPLNMDGSDSPRTQSVRAFARNLASTLQPCPPLLLWDERWSTQAVERAMIGLDISRAKRAERVDAAAAAYILQGAIEALCYQRSA